MKNAIHVSEFVENVYISLPNSRKAERDSEKRKNHGTVVPQIKVSAEVLCLRSRCDVHVS